MPTITNPPRTHDETVPISIRPARPDELDRARAVIEEAKLFLGGFGDQFGPQYALAVTADGAIVGVAGVEVYGDFGLLRSVCVLEPWRGRGIAARLVRDRIVWARARGLRALYLFTKNVAFWSAFDFEVSDAASWPAPLRASVQYQKAHERPLAAMALPLDGAAEPEPPRARD